MQGWIERSDTHGDVLVRRGRGLVTAVVDIAGPDGEPCPFVRVEIDCERPPGGPRAVRYRVHPLLPGDDPLAGQARRAQAEGIPVEWTVRWVRHDWIPIDLPVTSLDLMSDATAFLAGLQVGTLVDAALDSAWATLLSDGSGDLS